MKQKSHVPEEPEEIELELYGPNDSKDKKIKDFFYKLDKLDEKTDSKINLEISGFVDEDYYAALLDFMTTLASKETYPNKIVELRWDVFFNYDQTKEIKDLLLTKIVQKFNVTNLFLQLTDEDCKLLPNTIKILSIRCAKQLTDKGLATIVKRCNKLTGLKLIACQNLSNEGLKTLHPNIKHLTLNFCNWMDNESMKIIKEQCPNLGYLSIVDCTGISQDRIQTFEESNSECKVMNTARSMTEDRTVFSRQQGLGGLLGSALLSGENRRERDYGLDNVDRPSFLYRKFCFIL
jgi:hypothetical protein